ncbi:MAG: MFS transporter [Gammaproteobacteria bacterium]|nr:MFS transporter [Gammaproteobacteria bacterium]
MTDTTVEQSLIDRISVYRDPRLWRIFLLGTISGFPWVFIGSEMTAWLADVELSRSAIGLFGAVFVAYTVNFLWAPLIDHLPLPGFRRLGHRRSWIVLCMLLLIVQALVLAATGPSFSLLLTAALCLGIAIVSATQDLAIDAYRVTVIEEHEEHMIGHAAAMATCGWWTGLSLPGAFAFILADQYGWNAVYFGLTGILVVLIVGVLLGVKEPPRVIEPNTVSRVTRIQFFDRTYVAAVAEFFHRNGIRLALGLLVFIFVFKLGEAFLGRMVVVFYKEIGFTNADIGVYSKGLGLVITITCAIAAGFFTSYFGTVKGLMLAGIGMAATNLLFAWLATVGPDKSLLVFALVADGITSALSTVAFVAFITYFTSHLHAATQYGALASLGNAGRTLLAASSGILVDWLGGDWMTFFVLTAVMVSPALAILWWIGRSAVVSENDS